MMSLIVLSFLCAVLATPGDECDDIFAPLRPQSAIPFASLDIDCARLLRHQNFPSAIDCLLKRNDPNSSIALGIAQQALASNDEAFSTFASVAAQTTDPPLLSVAALRAALTLASLGRLRDAVSPLFLSWRLSRRALDGHILAELLQVKPPPPPKVV
jgi:hypothetical protein